MWLHESEPFPQIEDRTYTQRGASIGEPKPSPVQRRPDKGPRTCE